MFYKYGWPVSYTSAMQRFYITLFFLKSYLLKISFLNAVCDVFCLFFFTFWSISIPRFFSIFSKWSCACPYLNSSHHLFQTIISTFSRILWIAAYSLALSLPHYCSPSCLPLFLIPRYLKINVEKYYWKVEHQTRLPWKHAILVDNHCLNVAFLPALHSVFLKTRLFPEFMKYHAKQCQKPFQCQEIWHPLFFLFSQCLLPCHTSK